MAGIWHSFKTFCTRNRNYFHNYRIQVEESNLRMLRATLKVLFPFLICYSIWTTVTLRNPLLMACYIAIDAVMLGLILITRRFHRQMPEPGTIQATCVVCVCALMSFIIVISIFPFPEDPAIFYSLCYIITATLFAFSYQRILILMSIITVVYLVLVMLFRPESVAHLDRFGAVTTWIATAFFLLLISELRLRTGEAQALLEKALQTDSLTGLLNRRGIQAHMFPSFSQCQQVQLTMAVMMIDVDHFKSYNDAMGHPAGDDCLRIIGEVLGAFAGEYQLLAARYGGEEFLLLLPDTSMSAAQDLSEKLLERVRQKNIAGPLGNVTVSIGTVVRPVQPDDTLPDLIHHADRTLYHSKNAGRDRATVIGMTADD